VRMRHPGLMSVVTAVVFALLTAGLAPAGGPPPVPPGLARAVAAQEAHTDELLARDGVVGTAVGLGADGRAVVKIYTESAAVLGLPRKLDGIPADTEVIGKVVAHGVVPTRPAPIGTSTGSERLIVDKGRLYCTVGTIAARVSNATGVYALSNAHVYALEGSKTSGTVQAGASGDRILQPGRVDMTDQACGTSAEMDAAFIGRLASYAPIQFSRRASNTIDAAIATVSTATVGTQTPSGGYGEPSSTTSPAKLGMPVQKYGRTTGLTRGTVSGLNATVIISYDVGQARFVGQVIVQRSGGRFSDSGDSGSLIVTDDAHNSPVALLFAGSSSSTIANPINLVLEAFNVTIDGAR